MLKTFKKATKDVGGRSKKKEIADCYFYPTGNAQIVKYRRKLIVWLFGFRLRNFVQSPIVIFWLNLALHDSLKILFVVAFLFCLHFVHTSEKCFGSNFGAW